MPPKTDPKTTRPRIGPAQIRLLERLCNACAVSGDEGEVRAIVLEQVRPHAKQVKIDALGNVLVTCFGQAGNGDTQKRLQVLLAAHMDEVGFMITSDEGDGIFRFETVGGLDERQLVGKQVWVGCEHVAGVIGAKAIHITQPDELKTTIPLDTLRVDVAPVNNKVK